jgi:DNA-directed RNA polymerase, subunit H (EC 2.7.7.6)
LAQINLLVGGISVNQKKIIETAQRARDELAADIVIFPELTITGYPPEDLLLRPDFIKQANQAVLAIAQAVQGIDIVLGYPESANNYLYNSAAVLRDGSIFKHYRKNALPNFGVFDEQRYFHAGAEPCLFSVKNTVIALTICEDIWQQGLIEKINSRGQIS